MNDLNCHDRLALIRLGRSDESPASDAVLFVPRVSCSSCAASAIFQEFVAKEHEEGVEMELKLSN